ncbi:5'/3'-nucleotidase SurE [Synechococcus sp. C9]|uniref:5'/3'-nucleotidase SurE n=1 Tax=Synechococcus sp. C9 TaxID=102119 RepID=UPI001FF6D640|nr:5'/3'-nucleotidase SurE [Synechococcus sp. C9]
MRLLVSNDDGIFAPGLRALANTLAQAGHGVTVVAPDRERSATGHGLTLHKPIRVEPVTGFFNPTVTAWACTGTPADCVKLALGRLLTHPPDLVVSGINQGQNLGTDILYSGTVSAAMEGLIENIPGVALSLASYTEPEFGVASRFAAGLIQQLSQEPLPGAILLNVNIPAVAAQQIAGVCLTRQGVRRYTDQFDERTDPRGRTYYWLAGTAIEDEPEPDEGGQSDHWPTDVATVRNHKISITPLQYNLTHAPGLATLANWSGLNQGLYWLKD